MVIETDERIISHWFTSSEDSMNEYIKSYDIISLFLRIAWLFRRKEVEKVVVGSIENIFQSNLPQVVPKHFVHWSIH